MSKHPKGLPIVSNDSAVGQLLLEGGEPSDLEVVLAYHERTKHYPYRYAASLGYLDWANQPDPFRRYAGTELIELPLDTDWKSPGYDHLYVGNAIAAEPLSRGNLSVLLRHSLALSAWKRSGSSRWPLRVNPSSGNLHPTEGYLILPAVEGVAETAGVYHYAPKAHGLEKRASLNHESLQTFLPTVVEGCFFVGLSSVHWREAWKYGERAFRYCQHDVGHALAALRIAAAMLGWRLQVLEGVPSDVVGSLLGVARSADFLDAEHEEPELLALIDTRSVKDEPIDHVMDFRHLAASLEVFGQANRLSSEHAADWDLIETVSRATRTDGRKLALASDTSRQGAGFSREPHFQAEEPNAAELILKRRSAMAMDGATSIARADFFRMLSRLVPSPSAMPWDAVAWPAAIELVILVHRVSGLASGLYALLRAQESGDELRASLDEAFAWSKVTTKIDDLPLYLLAEGNFQAAAAAVSCGQRIASDGAFSVIMLAQYRRSLVERGPSFYRRLFWEAGMIGQVLYLEAEAANLRGTGIGCFFDDSVHTLLGLQGDAWQSLYHFTVGGPTHDERLETLPAYPESIAKRG